MRRHINICYAFRKNHIFNNINGLRSFHRLFSPQTELKSRRKSICSNVHECKIEKIICKLYFSTFCMHRITIQQA